MKISGRCLRPLIFTSFTDRQIPSTNTHGIGCTLPSEIASGLSRGRPFPTAQLEARLYLTDILSCRSFWAGNIRRSVIFLRQGPVAGETPMGGQPPPLLENPHERFSHTSSSDYRICQVTYRYLFLRTRI